jgi:hypothetical protein
MTKNKKLVLFVLRVWSNVAISHMIEVNNTLANLITMLLCAL